VFILFFNLNCFGKAIWVANAVYVGCIDIEDEVCTVSVTISQLVICFGNKV